MWDTNCERLKEPLAITAARVTDPQISLRREPEGLNDIFLKDFRPLTSFILTCDRSALHVLRVPVTSA